MRLGIDLGTCLSCAAVLVDGSLKLVKDPVRHGYSIPSSVYLSDKGELLVGHAADNNRRKDPSRYKREFKRDLGTVEPYRLGDLEYLPEDLSAEVLKKLGAEAGRMLAARGAEIDSALITVPANYQAHKRELVRRAGFAAGFASVDLLEEPVAAAVYYTWSGGRVEDGETLLVYDLGGGTFDAALIQRRAASYSQIAMPVGLEHCGGVDFDRMIYRDLQSKCSPELTALLDPTRRDVEALRARAIVADFCRDLKHQLSEASEASDEILLPRVDPETYEITRASFNRMIEPLLVETCEVCRGLVRSAGLELDNIRGVLLVGGSCRTPYVQEVVERELRRPVFWVEDPELAVCKGAAIFGVKATGQQPAREPATGPTREPEHRATPTGRSLVVSPKGQPGFDSIGDALQVAALGATIRILPGRYRESLHLDRPVEIVGAGPADEIVIENAERSCLVATTRGAVVRGVTLRVLAPTAGEAFPCVDIQSGDLLLEDCTVTSQSLACIAVHGEASSPTVKSCRIVGGAQSGIFVYEQARGLIEACEIAHNGYSGVDIGQDADPIVRSCRIHSNGQCGVCVFNGGRGLVEECEIFENTISGAMMRQGGAPAILRSTIRNEKAGVMVSVEGSGRVEQCEIRDCEVVGVDIKKGGDPSIVGCTISSGARDGITVRDGGKGTIRDCHVHGNAGRGLVIQEGCAPIVASNRIEEPNATPAAQLASEPIRSDDRVAAAGQRARAFLIAEQFLLLATDDQTGQFLAADSFVRYGLNAALIGEAALLGRLTLRPDGTIGPGSGNAIGDEALDLVLARISGTVGEHHLTRWIRSLDSGWGVPLTTFGLVSQHLERRGIFVGVPASRLAERGVPSGAGIDEKVWLRARIRDAFFSDTRLDNGLAILFALLRSCSVSQTVVTPHEIASRPGVLDALDASTPLVPALAHAATAVINEDMLRPGVAPLVPQ